MTLAEETEGMLKIPYLLMVEIEEFAAEEEVSVESALVGFLEAGRDAANGVLSRYGLRESSRNWQLYLEGVDVGPSTPVAVGKPVLKVREIDVDDLANASQEHAIWRYEALVILEDQPVQGGIIAYSDTSGEDARDKAIKLIEYLGVKR